jgi:O-antigen/teichoic acid export membrane protein
MPWFADSMLVGIQNEGPLEESGMTMLQHKWLALPSARRGVVTIVGGTAAGQILVLASAPVLSRLFTPSDFGLYAVLSSIASTLGIVAALRFELAIPVPDEEVDAYALVHVGLLSSLLVGMVTMVPAILLAPGVAKAFGQPALGQWLWMAPAAATAIGCYLTMNQLAIRKRRYGASGQRAFAQSVIMVGTQAVLGVAKAGGPGLFFGYAMGQIGGALALTRGAGMRSAPARRARTWATLVKTVRRYRKFPLVLAPAGLINVMSLQLPLILIAYLYGATVAGWLGMTQRVLALPAVLLGTAIGQVYLGELATSMRRDPAAAARLFDKASRALAAVALPLALGLFALGPIVFAVAFGAQWRMSGEFGRALALAMATQLVAVPLSQTLVVLERQGIQFLLDLTRLSVVVTSVVVAHAMGATPLESVWAFGVSTACIYAVGWLVTRVVLNRRGASSTLPRPVVP